MSDDSEAWKGEEEQPKSPFYSMWDMTFKTPTPEEKAKLAEERQRQGAAAELRALTLTAYNPAATCVKCGGERAKVRHCPGGESYRHATCFAHTAGHEHLHRTCKTCKYVWYELPLDTGR